MGGWLLGERKERAGGWEERDGESRDGQHEKCTA